jgi:hypothetical protein
MDDAGKYPGSGLYEAPSEFERAYDHLCQKKYGVQGGKKMGEKMPTIPHCGIQSAG